MMVSTAFTGTRKQCERGGKMWHSFKTEILAGIQNGGGKVSIEILLVLTIIVLLALIYLEKNKAHVKEL